MNEETMNQENFEQAQEKDAYVPSPKWKRVLAWILFSVVCIGIVLWLLGIAYPTWIDSAKAWLSDVF